jgi:hypothetical protein
MGDSIKMKKNLLIFSVIVMLLSITIVSAWEINPFADTKYYETSKEAITNDFIKQDFNSKYGVIQISKTFLWVETDRIAEYSLIESKDSIINSYVYGKATLYSDGKLFDDAIFKDVSGSEKELRDTQYLILVNKSYEEPTYKEICSKEEIFDKNGTLIKSCSWEKNGTIKIDSPSWEPYNFEILNAGNYEWKLETKKENINQKIDFIPYAQGLMSYLILYSPFIMGLIAIIGGIFMFTGSSDEGL